MARFAPIACLAAALELACKGPASADAELASAPVRAPALGISGCVESDELKAYVAALETSRREARAAALAALGARLEQRRGFFMELPSSAKLGDVFQDQGKRFGVVASYAEGFEPSVPLAKRGYEVRRIDERPRAHPVPILVCGVTQCLPASRGERSKVLPVSVELASGETLGAPLVLAYDYWWARVSYPKHQRCAATPAP